MPSLRCGIPLGQIAAKSGPLLAASDRWDIRITGHGTHAAHPHLGIDPFVVGAEIVQALQTIVSRSVDPLDSAVVSIGFMCGGSAYNAIPDGLHIDGTARSFRPQVQDAIERRIGDIARGAALAHGARAEVSYRRSYPPTINHSAETEFAAQVAVEICGSDQVLRDLAPSMGGEDFSFMLNRRPGAMLWLGNGPGEGDCFLHNAHYDFNDEAIPVGASFLARLAERFLEQAAR